MNTPPDYRDLKAIATASNKLLTNWIDRPAGKAQIATFIESHPEISQPIITKRGKGGGTYAHPKLAAIFAVWCNPSLPADHHELVEMAANRIKELEGLMIESAPALNEAEAWDEKANYVREAFRPHFDLIDNFVEAHATALIEELQKGKKLWFGDDSEIKRIKGESDDDFEERKWRIEMLIEDAPSVYRKKIDEEGCWIYEHGYDADAEDFDPFEDFHSKSNHALGELRWFMKQPKAHISEMEVYSGAVDQLMLYNLGTCIDLSGIIRSACNNFDKLQPAKGAAAKLSFQHSTAIDSCIKLCQSNPELKNQVARLESLKQTGQLALGGSDTVNIDPEKSALSRLSFANQLDRLN